MLGQFLYAGSIEVIPRTVVRRRCEDLLAEVGLDFTLPDSLDAYRQLRSETRALQEALFDVDASLAAAFLIGYTATGYFCQRAEGLGAEEETDEELRRLSEVTRSPELDVTIRELAPSDDAEGRMDEAFGASLLRPP